MNNFLLIKILYSAASVQGLFLVFLLLKSKINAGANRILAILILLLCFHLILVGFDNREFFLAFPHLSRISWIIGSLYGPLVFLFVLKLIGRKKISIWLGVSLFIPFFVLFMIMLPYYGLSSAEKISILNDFEKASILDFGPINQFVSLLHFVYQGACIFLYLRYEKQLRQEFSEIESIRIKWLKQFLILLFGATLLGVGAFFGKVLNSHTIGYLYNFHFLGVVLIFYWVSYKALMNPVIFGLSSHQPEIAQPTLIPSETEDKYSKSSLDDDRLQSILSKVQGTLISEKMFKNPNLTLSELSEKIGIPRHHVSQAINSKFSGNFFDLVNDYRVSEFKSMALDPTKKHLSLLGIAQEAGFNSKASFYAVFKKKTGMTPSAFVESQSKVLK